MSAVRCGHCPGATPEIIRRARGVCSACAVRLAEINDALRQGQLRCPTCRGRLFLDLEASTNTGRCIAVFCTGCEFAKEIETGAELS